MNRMNRKAQVTIFIIIGIVLLLILILFLMLRKNVQSIETEVEVHDFSSAIFQYESAASTCLESEGARVLKQVFATAGYQNAKEEGFVGLESFPLQGSALWLSDEVIVPYWLTYTTELNCGAECSYELKPPVLMSEDPTEITIETKAEALLEEQIPYCLTTFDMSNDYELQHSNAYDIDITIARGMIYYTMNHPVTITYLPLDVTTSIEETTTSEVSHMLEMYTTALDIINQLELSEESFGFADLIASVIAGRSMGYDPDIPPMYGTLQFEKDRSYWFLNEVEESLKTYLSDDISLLSLYGSADEKFFVTTDPFDRMIYNTGVFKPGMFYTYPEYIPKLSADFIYKSDWDILLQVSGDQTGQFYITPITYFDPPNMLFLDKLLPGLYENSFVYDMRMPLLISLKDDESFDGKGLSLMFAIQTGLSDNSPIPFVYTEEDVLFDAGIEEDQEEEIDIYETITFFNDEDQLLDNSEVSFIAKNALTGEVLEGARISYICGTDSIVLGETNRTGELESKLPFCIGGKVTTYYFEHSGAHLALDSYDDDALRDSREDVYELLLYPLKEFSVQLAGYPFTKSPIDGSMYCTDAKNTQPKYYFSTMNCSDGEMNGTDYKFDSWMLGSEETRVNLDEELIVIFTRETLPGEQEYTNVVSIDRFNQDTESISLFPGKYSIQVFKTLNMGPGYARDYFEIPEQVIEVKGEDDITIDPIIIEDTMYKGGLDLMAEYGLFFEILPEDYASSTITVRYVDFTLDAMTTPQDLALLGEIDIFSAKFNNTLMPEIHS